MRPDDRFDVTGEVAANHRRPQNPYPEAHATAGARCFRQPSNRISKERRSRCHLLQRAQRRWKPTTVSVRWLPAPGSPKSIRRRQPGTDRRCGAGAGLVALRTEPRACGRGNGGGRRRPRQRGRQDHQERRKTCGTLRDLLRVNSVGIIEEDAARGIVGLPSRWGSSLR